MKVFITGATGFIGRHVVQRLAAANHTLYCLVRPTSDARPLEALGAIPVTGDVTCAGHCAGWDKRV